VYSDGLGNIESRHPDLECTGIENTKTHPQLEISTKSGMDVALDILRAENARSTTYIALGPLTDLALMMRKDPATVRDRIGCVCSMGGALDVPGNTTPVAECDPFS
jgi:inosine-uridine nucleoside N-ribohydrolase